MATPNPKPLLILIHGGASSSRAYDLVIPLLESPTYTTIALDLPGHGTLAPNGPFTFPSAIETILHCISTHTSSPSALTTPPKILLLGISLGGQVTLSFLQNHPSLITAAFVSGVSIHPPSEGYPWELPRMPSDPAILSVMMDDVARAGMENMDALRGESLAFTFCLPPRGPRAELEREREREREQGQVREQAREQKGSGSGGGGFPPVLVMIGEHDIAMARRDFNDLVGICKEGNQRSEGVVLSGAWHNHCVDVPGRFAEVVRGWMGRWV